MCKSKIYKNNKYYLWAMMLAAIPVSAEEIEKNETVGFYPNVSVELAWDDNIFRTETGEVDDVSLVVEPELYARGRRGKHSWSAYYRGAYGRYLDTSTENYNDHDFGAEALLDLSKKANLELIAELGLGHDSRGSASTNPNASVNPDEWRLTKLKGIGTYGRRTNRGQLVGSVEWNELSYLNNAQEFRDRENLILTGTFYYNWTRKTSLLAEISRSWYDYQNNNLAPTNLDSVDTRYLIGAEWKATAKTNGEIKIGWADKDLDDAAQEDFSGLHISARMGWNPRERTRFAFQLTRETQESSVATSSFFVRNLFSASWDQNFARYPKWNLHMRAAVENDDFTDGRSDDLFDYEVDLFHQTKRWLRLGGGYRYSTRDSTLAGLGYDGNTLFLRAETTFE